MKLNEGLNPGDLSRLIKNTIHIDEYSSKMGNDEDIITISFMVQDREPSQDLVNFLEKGYPWVLDAEVSPGELSSGKYLVFVEMARKHAAPKQIFEMLEEIFNLVDFDQWYFVYYRIDEKIEATIENLTKILPLSPKDYNEFHNKYDDEEDDLGLTGEVEPEDVFDEDIAEELRQMQAQARVPVTQKPKTNPLYSEELKNLQAMARIRSR